MKPGEPFNPRHTFVGLFVPAPLAASPAFSSTAKLVYGHLVRRAGESGRCWPSATDVALHTGIGERAAQRALKELQAGDPPLIRASSRTDSHGRQTSNEYQFIWSTLFESVNTDGPVKNDTPSPVKNDTPEGVKNDRDGGVENDTRKVKEEKCHRKRTTTTQSLQPSLSRGEYVEFCQQCARERLPVPDRETAAAIKQRFPGSWNNRACWLQLRAFPGQKSARLWLTLDREQVLMEIERQDLTPPKLTAAQQTHAAATAKFLEKSS